MYEKVLYFWFEEIENAYWWKKDKSFDLQIKNRFMDLHEKAAHCELSAWRESPRGRLAEIIILDQFSRNVFRDQEMSFQQDPLALALSQEAISNNAHKQLNKMECCFLYMPFMHSESLAIHETAVKLFEELGNSANYEFELKHKAIIERFGRYPHRNAILQRKSTPEELEFLEHAGSSF